MLLGFEALSKEILLISHLGNIPALSRALTFILISSSQQTEKIVESFVSDH